MVPRSEPLRVAATTVPVAVRPVRLPSEVMLLSEPAPKVPLYVPPSMIPVMVKLLAVRVPEMERPCEKRLLVKNRRLHTTKHFTQNRFIPKNVFLSLYRTIVLVKMMDTGF